MTELGWNDQIVSLPGAHVLQTTEWAEVKQEVGWRSTPLVWKDETERVVGAANFMIRSVRPLGFGPKFSVGYIPRGPMLDWSDPILRKKILDEIEQFARKEKLIFVKMDPEVEIGRGIPGEDNSIENPVGARVSDDLQQRGWRLSPEQVQFKNTAVLNLEGTEEDWLKRMKQKTRYNLRLSQRNGVTVRVAMEDELPALYHMYAQTASRDNFIIREEAYYLGVWKRFIDAGMAEALIAEVEGQSVSGLILFFFGKRAWYLYGMSSPLHREKMPNYLLQWEAMCKAKAHGCTTYDLWGAPDVFNRDDPMYGVYRFKEGLGAMVIRTTGAWDYSVRPLLYFLYQKVLPRLLAVTRLLRRGKLQQEVS